MEPTRDTQVTLVDLLDRILDKGLVINADIIISVAGIPLIGVNLRAALAGMETMLKYGMMKVWDEKIRAQGANNRTEACPQCGKGANVLELLEKGCTNCGWVSPRLKKKVAKVAVSAE